MFFKDIDNPIFNRIQMLEDDDFEGRFYSELEIQQFQNATPARSSASSSASSSSSPGCPACCAAWASRSATPGPTAKRSRCSIATRTVPFFLQSEHIGNVALFYELSGIELRLAYAYRSEYLDAIGDTAAQDLYVDEHGQLDFKASYQFTEAGLGVHPVAEHQRRAAALLQRRPLAARRERDLLLERMLAGMTFKF